MQSLCVCICVQIDRVRVFKQNSSDRNDSQKASDVLRVTIASKSKTFDRICNDKTKANK